MGVGKGKGNPMAECATKEYERRIGREGEGGGGGFKEMVFYCLIEVVIFFCKEVCGEVGASNKVWKNCSEGVTNGITGDGGVDVGGVFNPCDVAFLEPGDLRGVGFIKEGTKDGGGGMAREGCGVAEAGESFKATSSSES